MTTQRLAPPEIAELYQKHGAWLVAQAAVQQLPEEQREVVVLHVWGELTFQEIAEASTCRPIPCIALPVRTREAAIDLEANR